MKLKTELQKIRERVNLASPGPWQVNGDHFSVCSTGNSSEDGHDYSVCMNGYAARDGIGHSDAMTDAEFIAHARTDIPRLLACVERLVEGLDGYEKKLEELADVLLNGNGNIPKQQRIHEHDACLIACGFLKGDRDKTLEAASAILSGTAAQEKG